MPNHVRTIIKFKNLKPDDVTTILNIITSPCKKVGSEEKFPAIDFNKIIPEPRTIGDCSPKFIIPEEKRAKPGIEITDERNWFDWYNWRVYNWGTKWNAYDCDTKIGKTYITFIFSTAWSVASGIIEKLRLFRFDMEIKYADEALGSNCGMFTYNYKSGWTHVTEEDGLENPREFARNIWRKY